MGYSVRLADRNDLPRILDIYEIARNFMAKNGNPTQWAGGYPAESLLEGDILLSLEGEALTQLQEQLILCQSFSKPYAMTGWRVGYLTCPDYVMDRLLLLSASMITAVPTFVQEAAIAALQEDLHRISSGCHSFQRKRDYPDIEQHKSGPHVSTCCPVSPGPILVLRSNHDSEMDTV